MYKNVSPAFLQEIAKKTQIRSYRCQVQYWDASGKEKTEVLEAEEWELGSTEIDSSCLPSSVFELGGTVAASVTSVLKNDTLKWKGCRFVGGYIRPYFGLKVGNDFEWVPIGWFIIDGCSKTTAKSIKITAVDSIVRAEKVATVLGVSFPCTLETLAQACASYIGCQLGTVYGAAFSINKPDNLDSITVRDLIGGIAAVSGRFARIDADNRLQFVSFSPTPSAEIKGDEVRFSCDVGEPNVVDSVVYYGKDKNYIAGNKEGKNPIIINENPIFENFADYLIYSGKELIDVVLQSMYDYYKGLKIVPCEVSYAGNPCIQAGDCISLPSTIDGDVITIATSVNLGITTTSSISCVDCNPISSDFYNTRQQTGGSNDGLSMSQVNGAIDDKLNDFKNSFSGGGCNHNLLTRQFFFHPLVTGTDNTAIKYNQIAYAQYMVSPNQAFKAPCTRLVVYRNSVVFNVAAYNLRFGETYTISYLYCCVKTPGAGVEDFVVKHSYNGIPAKTFSYSVGGKTLGTIRLRSAMWGVQSLTFTLPPPDDNPNLSDSTLKAEANYESCHIFRLESENYDTDVWIQQVKLEKGDKFTGFDSLGGTEENIAMSCKRAQFDENIILELGAVHGTCPPGDRDERGVLRWVGLDEGDVATSTSNGLMSSADKAKLDNMSNMSIDRITNAQIDTIL